MTQPFVIGSRGSKLARWQSERVAALLQSLHGPAIDVQIRIFTTRGDVILDKPLPEIGGKGLFTAELEEALNAGEIAVAVHSLKDLPTEQPDGLALLALPQRADARDALLVRADHLAAQAERIAEHPEGFDPRDPLSAVPEGAVVGTSSLRRQAQFLRLRPDVDVRSIRGNVDTRLRKMDEGEYDAILLACAGLDRMGLGDRIHRRLDSPWLGAAGQGCMAVQGRADDEATAMLLHPLEHRPTRLEVEAERGVLAALGGGCSLPLGVSGRVSGDRLSLDAILLSTDGTSVVSAKRVGEATRTGAARLARTLCRDLHDRGAQALLSAIQ